MRKHSLLFTLLLASSIAAAPIPAIQQIQAGNWTGTATDPDDRVSDIVFEVSTEEGLAITLQVTEQGLAIPAIEPALDGTTLTFGVPVNEYEVFNCSLERQDDGSFQGECVDSDGGIGYVVMNPPQVT